MSFKKRLLKLTSATVCSTLLATMVLPQISSATPSSPHLFHPKFPGKQNSSSVPSAAIISKSVSLKPAFISPNLKTDSAAETRVIVRLSSQPTAVGKFAAKAGAGKLAAESTESALQAEQTAFIGSASKKGLKIKVHHQFKTVLNGLEVSIPANQIPELAKLPGVLSVYENRTYTPIPVQEPSAEESDTPFDTNPIHQIGADAAWAKGLTGAGLKVGVIDTGVDYKHPDLAGAYKGGYDSSNQDSDPYEDYDPVNQAFTEHGTHVSGTIVGRAANKTSSLVQKGIAYESDLYVYKVLSATGDGNSSGTTATVIDGIERAVRDGMDVLNLSLGADGDKDPNSPDAIAVNNAVLAGTVVVVANGNAGDAYPYYYTMGTPATSQLGISVGAATSPGSRFEADFSSSLSAASYELHAMGWRTTEENFSDLLGAAPLDAVYVGLGNVQDYEGIDVTGKVVLISRGIIPFVDKIAFAKSHGAKAAIIFNGNANAEGQADLSESVAGRDGFIGSLGFLGDSFDFIPTYDMSGAEGRALARSIIAAPDTPLTFSFSGFEGSVAEGDHMATFSSRGPNSDSAFGIKPDFTAPGVSIMSTWPMYGKFDRKADYDEAYNRISGTSMATPHVAGLSLLLLQEHPDWTPFDVRAALANTADSTYDESGQLYDVYTQGAGRVNIANAIETPALLQTIDELTIYNKNLQPVEVTNYGDSASFGLMDAGEAAASGQLQLKNTSDSAVTYTAAVVMHNNVSSYLDTPDPSAIDVSLQGLTNGTVTAAANAATPFTLSLAPRANAAEGIYEGEVVLQSAGLPTLHLPFAVHVGDETPDSGLGLQQFEVAPKVISPAFEGIEGVQESMNASFELKADNSNYLDVEIYDLEDNLLGIYTDFLNMDDSGLHFIEPGTFQIAGLGTAYYPVDENGNLIMKNGSPVTAKLTDGTYRLNVNALQLGIDENGGLYLETDAAGNPIYFSALTTFGVQTDADALLVKKAATAFKAKITNNLTPNEPVLILPTANGITYAVTGSSNPSLITADGLFKAKPSSTTTVKLTVTIASAASPEVYTNVTVSVKLQGTKR
ncbi:S8 family serine peptidase [Paenibacillus montanisoli]|uniref:Peptidase n=1 Tax=Paenibacillus montanisoli TaxID=2081970 RepID=A0A328U3H7_9BACL|nr:S8 family serine peptidase [Paenibacillus montanisoli]RAP74544.1 peptidase [Paenibacillus montanisoli]